jgi:hypothetical protein
MPQKGGSCLFLPRLKEGEDPNVFRHIRVSYEALEALFHLPLKDAAREIGLCPTTFKKACRHFDLQKWPARQMDREAAIARMNAQTDGVDAAIRPLHQEPVCAPDAPTLQTEVHLAKNAVTVSCPSPAWHDGSSAWRHTSHSGFPFSSAASSSSNVRSSSELHRGCATSLEAGPPRELSCVEAVMEYLDLGRPISEADVESMLSDDF